MRTATPYDEIAEWYDGWIRDGVLLHDLLLPTVLDLIGDVEGQRVCDLACGQGVIARQLAERGALVTGVDISCRLLAIARGYELEDPAGIEYVWGDAQGLVEIPDESFDGVVCNMALMDIPNLPATLVTRILHPRGWFVFSIASLFPNSGLEAGRRCRRGLGLGDKRLLRRRFLAFGRSRRYQGENRFPPPHPERLPELPLAGRDDHRARRRAPGRGQARPAYPRLPGGTIGTGGAVREVVG